MASFSSKSAKTLATAHPDLRRLFAEVVKGFDCTVLEAARSEEEEAAYIASGKSKLKDPKACKHVPGADGFAHAVDVAPYPIDWQDRERFTYFAGYVLGVASQLGISIRWGGDWDSDREVADNGFDDLVHFEMRD